MAAVLLSLGASNAIALSMGKLRVQSALGQSLVAEIDLADLSEDEAGSLKSELAAPSTFTGMGLEYNSGLNGTQIALQRRPNGSRYLKVTGNRTLNDPFVDLLVELSWGSGKIVRTYTILLDPPKSQDLAAPPVLPAAGSDTQATAPKVTAAAVATANSAPTTNTGAGTSAGSANKVAASTLVSPAAASNSQQRVKVVTGDNAGKIARAWATEGASVEQMLIAILNANPSAFVGGNVNRLMANTEILVPDAATVKKTSPSEAQRLIHRQNQDFQNLRSTLAGQAPSVAPSANPTETAGKVAPATPAANPKTASGDTLKLSKGTAQDVAEKANMEQIAQQRAKNEASERARELAKNIEELNQLAKVAAKPDQGAASTLPNPASSSPSAESSASSATVAAPAAPKASTPAPVVAASLPPKAQTGGLFDSITREPEVVAFLLAVLGLLGGLGWYRRMQAKKNGTNGFNPSSKWNSSASTSFTLGSAQRVDTSEAGASGLHSSMYQESQLELANELDPVAEAEVYLAYGKDVPAEEILKEGLQHTPHRVAIHLKLLAIYAKRGDTKSFEAMVREVSVLTQASGSEWAHVVEMGLELDPTNPLYSSGVIKAAEPAPSNSSFQNSIFHLEPDDMEALSGDKDDAAGQGRVAGNPITEELSTASLPLPFESSSISLDATPVVSESAFATTERLDATLALAEQFLEIGEKEGARALIEEVMAGGNEALRKRASELLAKAR